MLRVRAKNGGVQMDHRSEGCCRSQPTAPEAGVLGRRNVSPAGGTLILGNGGGFLPRAPPHRAGAQFPFQPRCFVSGVSRR